MKTSVYMRIILVIVYICIIKIHNSHSLVIPNEETADEKATQINHINDLSSFIDEYESKLKLSSAQKHSIHDTRRSESAEKYFGWASKTNRPIEYFRGRRFWLFTKKDDQGIHSESMPATGGSSNSLSQGIWRSGIVGRRR